MFRDIYRTVSRRAASFFSSKLNIFKAIYPEAAVAFTVTLALFFVLHTAISIAAPPPTPFEPGETLDPGCAPGEENCFVSGAPDLSEVDSDDLEEGEANLYFTPERVSNHIDVLANTAARHAAVTLSGSNYLTLTGQEITAGTIDISDHTNLSAGSGLLLTNDSLSASGLTTGNFASSNISQWTNDSGFISSYTETDPIFAASDVSDVVSADIVNWNTAFGWGDHSAAGYFSLDNKPSLSVIPPAESNFFGGLASAVNSGTIRTLHIRADSTFTFDQFFVHETTTESPRVTIYESDINENLLSTIQEFVSSDATVEIIDAREYRKYELLEAQIIESGEYILIELDYSENPSTWNRVKGSGDDDLPLTDGDLTLVGLGGTTSSHGKDIILRSGDPIPKGVVGPLDPTDLPGYGLATEGQVLTRTANGAEFTTLTTGNFATPNISQWTNDSGFITNLSTFDASDLSILDAGGHFTATTVEDALAELFATDASAFSPLNKPRLSEVPAQTVTTDRTSGWGADSLDTYLQAYFQADANTPFSTLQVKVRAQGGNSTQLNLQIFEADGVFGMGDLVLDVDSDTYTGSLVDPHWVTFTFPEFTPTVGQNYVIRVNIGPNWTYPNSLFYEGANGTGSNSVTIGDYTIPEMSVVINGTAEATRAWGLKIGTAATPKGVVGPIDPDDLANYSDASTNTFLRKTDNGLEFTSFPSDEQLLLSADSVGMNVDDGSLYINPSSLSGNPPVEWTRNAAWDGPAPYTYSGPAFADMDADGDDDLFVTLSNGVVYGYENTGSPASPSWARKIEWDIDAPGSDNFTRIALGDLDDDGDFDAMVAVNDASPVVAYENTGSVNSPTWTANAAWDIPDNAGLSVALKDLDNDGDLDAFVNQAAYRNVGTPNAPSWTAHASWNVSFAQYPSAISDFDGDGDLDLLAGTPGGTVLAFENTGSVSSPSWTSNSAFVPAGDFGSYTNVATTDLDGDGDDDILIGASGTMRAYENTGSAISSMGNTLLGIAVNGSEKLRVNGQGNVYATGDMHATGFVNTSTEEAKENITFLTADRERNILSDIRILDIANYRYLTDEVGEPLRLGLIAERSPSEILSADGKGVDLYKLSTFTLAGLKSLTEKVDNLESTLLLDGVVLDGVGDEEIKPQNPFVAALKKVGLTIMDGILSIKKLITGEVKTDKLCVGDTCVTETEFLEILQNANVEPHSEETPTNEPENGEEDPAQEGPEETPEPEQENETPTPDPEEGATPEPEPVIEGGAVSDETDPLAEGNEEEEDEDAETQDEGSTPEEREASGDVL